jgi:hypothetical protein
MRAMSKKNRISWLPLAALLTSLSACTTQNVYDSSQSWQKLQCQKIINFEERQRCEKSTAMSYEKYRAEVEASKQKP